MKINLKEEVENIEIPKELHSRVELGVNQAWMEEKNKHSKRLPMKKIVISAAAAVVVFSGTWAVGGVDATETLINKIFGSRNEIQESYPQASVDDIGNYEQHLELAKEHLTENEFSQYASLHNEAAQLVKKMTVKENGQDIQNPELLSKDEQNRFENISKKIEVFRSRLSQLTTKTFEEAQKMVTYPMQKPSFVPEGYVLVNELAKTNEKNINQDPTIELHYEHGEFGYRIFQSSLSNKEEDELERRVFDHKDSYTLENFTIDYEYSDGSKVKGMRLTNTNQGYKIVIISDLLSQEELENILLSMVKE
ncbi:hypothetical protein SM124_09665 [Bacillus sp. 31A1R]|uniref:DUF4367 domain-containing protein n=1 Tax=Robertmurraya mangrovi TaxID=3098077 RepID=A0ABU5IY42_9BACI|nr:hypothetical protein [Bacillus sp. 31A1R]MDZ5472012.1 hypothetical protein [Bacillus sp. 31A1R]